MRPVAAYQKVAPGVFAFCEEKIGTKKSRFSSVARTSYVLRDP